jgi:hypothetical protein
MSILTDGLRLARLTRSVGTKHAHPRPLPPIEVAQCMAEMIECLNDRSNEKTAKRLGISKSMINDFLSLTKLPSKYADLWGFGSDKDGKIPFSMFRRAGNFYENNIISEDEFGILVGGVLNDQIDTSSIEKILYLKKKNPEKSIQNCCKEILNLIPEKIESIIFITDLDSDVIDKLRDNANKNSKSLDDVIYFVLSKYFGSENVGGFILKNENHIKIEFTKEGRSKLSEIAKNNKKSTIEIINYLFLKEGFGNV